MQTVHIGKGKDTLTVVEKAPAHLDKTAKSCFIAVGNFLAKRDRLSELHLHNLEVYAVAYSQWVFANKWLTDLNKEDMGSGFIQTFKTGAQQLSPQVILRNDAADTMLKCSKQFGLDPKSEKDLRSVADDSQTKMNFEDDFNKNKLSNY